MSVELQNAMAEDARARELPRVIRELANYYPVINRFRIEYIHGNIYTKEEMYCQMVKALAELAEACQASAARSAELHGFKFTLSDLLFGLGKEK